MINRKLGEAVEFDHGMTLTLARERFGLYWLRVNALHDVRANAVHEMQEDPCKKAMMHRLESDLLTMDEREITAQWPQDWWQAFRLRWFPPWWLARWPVEYRYLREKQYGKVFLSVFPDRTTKHHGSHMNIHHFDGCLVP